MIEILFDDSTSCKEACDNNDYRRSRQQQTFNMSVKSMRISLDHFIYCIVLYKCKTIFFYLWLYIKHYMHSIRKCVQKVIDNNCNNSPYAW